MFTRKSAMVNIMTGAVTAGMGLGMVAPMVAYAEPTTTDDLAQVKLTDTQKSYLKEQLEAIETKCKALKDMAEEEDLTSLYNWLNTYLTAYATDIASYKDTLTEGDRTKASEIKDALSEKYTNFTGHLDGDTELTTKLGGADAEEGLKKAVDEAKAAFQDTISAFTSVVDKNSDPTTDPTTTEFDGLSWSNPMVLNTYSSTFEEDYGTYANLDFSYKREAGADGHLKWTMPQELADAGFTIVTTGMLAPQASLPEYGSTKGAKAPDIYVSDDKKSIIIEIPEGVDGNGHANGTFSFAIHSDKKVNDAQQKLDAFIVTKSENGDFAHVPMPESVKGKASEAAASGYTKQATSGDREAKHTFIIKFSTNGGTYIADRTVTDGNLANVKNWAQNLPSPSKTGFRFVGWFTDEACSTVFDPFQTDLKDMTLYAKYIQTVNPESTTAARTAAQKSDLLHTGDTNAYIATVAAVTVGAGLAVTVLRRRQR